MGVHPGSFVVFSRERRRTDKGFKVYADVFGLDFVTLSVGFRV